MKLTQVQWIPAHIGRCCVFRTPRIGYYLAVAPFHWSLTAPRHQIATSCIIRFSGESIERVLPGFPRHNTSSTHQQGSRQTRDPPPAMCQRPALPACENDAGDRWHVRLGLVFFAVVALGSSWFNLVLLSAGPLGWAIELAVCLHDGCEATDLARLMNDTFVFLVQLLFWVFRVDDVAFNGRGRPILAMRRGWYCFI